MEARLTALKLFLDELNIDASIKTIADRKRIQKAVYLGQLTGVDLGYRFSWYLMGPYSTSLTQDYYQLVEAIDLGDKSFENMKLLSLVKKKLQTILPVFQKPEQVQLDDQDWLELVASLHYLRNVSKYSQKDAFESIEKDKPHLKDFLKNAESTLNKFQPLS